MTTTTTTTTTGNSLPNNGEAEEVEMVKMAGIDSINVNVPKKLMSNMSKVIKDVIEELQPSKEVVIPLPNANESSLKTIIQYCEPKKKEGENNENNGNNDALADWEKDFFVSLETSHVMEVITTANYLNIESIVNSGAKIIALRIQGKSVEELRQFFNISNDFTPQEEEDIRRATEWCDQ